MIPYAKMIVTDDGVYRECPECGTHIKERGTKSPNYGKHYTKEHGR